VALSGAILVPLQQPLPLLVISGVLSGLTMAIYTPILIYMNNVRLPKPLRPSAFTNAALFMVALFYAFFAAKIIGQYF
jgi:Mn2+/Fe2+ NRAMP family transporter